MALTQALISPITDQFFLLYCNRIHGHLHWPQRELQVAKSKENIAHTHIYIYTLLTCIHIYIYIHTVRMYTYICLLFTVFIYYLFIHLFICLFIYLDRYTGEIPRSVVHGASPTRVYIYIYLFMHRLDR